MLDSPGNIPVDIKEAIDRYVSDGLMPGSFTKAVLENDLLQAVSHIHPMTLPFLSAIVSYCHWVLPGACYGSPEKVAAWIKKMKEAKSRP